MKTILILTIIFSYHKSVSVSTEAVEFNTPTDCNVAANHFSGTSYQEFIRSARDYHYVRISATCHPKGKEK